MGKLEGKVAVVSGASKGIGAAIAKALAAEGAAVVANYASSKSGAEAVVSAITEKGGKATVKGEVSKTAEAEAIIDAALKTYRRLDILVNNAGVYEAASLEEISEQHFHRLFDINVLGLLNTTKAAAGHLREGASIINISSPASRITSPGYAVYGATKGAVDVLAKEFGPRGSYVPAATTLHERLIHLPIQQSRGRWMDICLKSLEDRVAGRASVTMSAAHPLNLSLSHSNGLRLKAWHCRAHDNPPA